MTVDAYPLQWPHGRPRTRARTDSRFSVDARKAYEEMIDELDRFGAKNVVVSTNIPLRRDGSPYKDGLTDDLPDPGVAVYFMRGKTQCCLPCDTYLRPWENCRAIGKAVEGFRAMERNGTGQIVDQAFTGFVALPPPSGGEKHWREVLGFADGRGITIDEITSKWKSLCREAGEATVELNAAKDAALMEIAE